MRCTTCDDEMPPDATFCVECGTRVPAASSAGARTVRIAAFAEAPDAGAPPPLYPTPELESYAIQPYAPQPYAPQPYAPAIAASQTSTAATISLVFGILGLFPLLLIGAIVAIVAGHLALREIHASGDQIGGRKLATVGLTLGYAQLVVPLLLLAYAVLFVFH